MFYRSKVKTLSNKTCNSAILLFNTVIFRKKPSKKNIHQNQRPNINKKIFIQYFPTNKLPESLKTIAIPEWWPEKF